MRALVLAAGLLLASTSIMAAGDRPCYSQCHTIVGNSVGVCDHEQDPTFKQVCEKLYMDHDVFRFLVDKCIAICKETKTP